ALDGDRHAERHDQRARVDEEAAVLEELDDGVEGTHGWLRDRDAVIGLLGGRRRRLRRVLLLLDGLRVVARLPAKDFAIERRKRLVEDADERSPAQVA